MAGAIPFSEYVARFSQLVPSLNTALDKELDEAAPIIKGIIQSVTKTVKPASPNGGRGAVATGQYLADWKAYCVNQGRSKGIFISNSQKYAVYVDYGRRPGALPPPHEAIKKWAMVRLGYDEAAADKAAYPIAKAIAKRGLLARGVLHSDQRNAQLARFMEKRFSRAIAVTTRKVMGV